MGILRRLRKGYVNLGKPDAAGKFEPQARYRKLKWVWKRDGKNCGLCAARMPLKGAHLEHIVPKLYPWFSVTSSGTANVQGDDWRSRMHHLDNLQAAHSYCNRNKGNKKNIRLWRNSKMPQTEVARDKGGASLMLPQN